MRNDSVSDVESGSPKTKEPNNNTTVLLENTSEAETGEVFLADNTLYGRINRFVSKFKVEARGIERVPEDERVDTSLSHAATVWLSSNMTVSAFALGALATPVFGLGFVDSILTILFINILGVIPVAFYSTFGPQFGLRQMVLGRYWFGYHSVKVFAILNSLAAVGWSAVNSIVGAQLFHAVNPAVPGWAGIIIIAAGCGIVTLFGYKVVHLYQKWSWIPSFIVFLIILGEFAHSGQFHNLPLRSGSSEAGSVLSFAASIFGNSTGWSTYAADYTVYMKKDTPRWKIFIWTFAGLCFPLVFTQMLGAAIATATINNTDYANGYEAAGIGGLLAAVLFPPLGRFGQFCLVILALGIIANNCPNQYSISLNLQILSQKTQHVPRFIWTCISVVVFAAIAIPGYSDFESVLENFMLIIAYWVAIYEGISLIDHFVFRRGFIGYAPEFWNQSKACPPGIAAIIATCFGIMGAVLGMSQVWFVGPIGKHIGNPAYGGDVGFELAFAFSAVAFILCRYVERKYFKR